MSMVHVCDACRKVIQHPHDQKMREFTLNTSYDYGTVLTNPTVERKEIHLCDNCFHALYLIAEGAKMPGQPEQPIGQTIKVKYLSDKIEKLDYIASKSDWIDLRAAENVDLKAGDFKLIPLGVAMQLPKGYEAHIIPRSSTFKNFGVIQANHMGMVDESYCGDNDQWYFPAIAMRDTSIKVGDRICQFRIVEHQPQISFEAVETLGNEDRGGIGSTGTR